MTLLQLTKKHLLAHLSLYNKHYINSVEISNGKSPKNLSKMAHGISKQEVLCDILNAYKTHPGIRQIQKKFNEQNFFRKENFFFKPVTPPEIEYLINCLDTNKAAGKNTIPPKLIFKAHFISCVESSRAYLFLPKHGSAQLIKWNSS